MILHPVGQAMPQQMLGCQEQDDQEADKNIADEKSDDKICHITFPLFWNP